MRRCVTVTFTLKQADVVESVLATALDGGWSGGRARAAQAAASTLRAALEQFRERSDPPAQPEPQK